MPLDSEIRDHVIEYCDAHVLRGDGVSALFDFIDSKDMRERLVQEYEAARYVYKLGEALAASDRRLYAHVKFQIVQYAAIYEAIIVYLLWTKFSAHPAVADIEFHSVYKKAGDLPQDIQISKKSGEEIHLCVDSKQRTSRASIKFDDKVGAAIKIGFINPALAEEIKVIYKQRNAIHIESALKNQIDFELNQSMLAYRRMVPFIAGIKSFLKNGSLPYQKDGSVKAKHDLGDISFEDGADGVDDYYLKAAAEAADAIPSDSTGGMI